MAEFLAVPEPDDVVKDEGGKQSRRQGDDNFDDSIGACKAHDQECEKECNHTKVEINLVDPIWPLSRREDSRPQNEGMW